MSSVTRAWFWWLAELVAPQWANPGARWIRRKDFKGFTVYPECDVCGEEHGGDCHRRRHE